MAAVGGAKIASNKANGKARAHVGSSQQTQHQQQQQQQQQAVAAAVAAALKARHSELEEKEDLQQKVQQQPLGGSALDLSKLASVAGNAIGHLVSNNMESDDDSSQSGSEASTSATNSRKRKLADSSKPQTDDEDDDDDDERSVKRMSSETKDADSETDSQDPNRRSRKSSKSFLNSMPRVMDHGMGPQGHSQMRFALETNWHPSYVRTRHKNLRCFPFCAPEHKERSFCGLPITVFLRCPDAQTARKLHLMGRFRKVREKPMVEIGVKSSSATSEVSRVVFASFQEYNEAEGVAVFDFMPPRKWRYHCEQNKYTTSELHAFTAYVFDDRNICIDIKDSPHFRIVSAWRQDVNTVSRPLHPMLHRRNSISSAPETMQQAQHQVPGLMHQRRSSFVNTQPESMGMMSSQMQAQAQAQAIANYQQFLRGQQQQQQQRANAFYSANYGRQFSLQQQQLAMQQQQPLGGFYTSLTQQQQPSMSGSMQPQQQQALQMSNALSEFIVSLGDKNTMASLAAAQRGEEAKASMSERSIPPAANLLMQNKIIQSTGNNSNNEESSSKITQLKNEVSTGGSNTSSPKSASAMSFASMNAQPNNNSLGSFCSPSAQTSNGNEASTLNFPWNVVNRQQSQQNPGNMAFINQLQALLGQQANLNTLNASNTAPHQAQGFQGSGAPFGNIATLSALAQAWPAMQQQPNVHGDN